MENNTTSYSTSNKLLAQNCVRELKLKYSNYSSAQIAREIGMIQSTFCRIENGQSNPSLNSINKLLSALGQSHKMSDAIAYADPSLALTIKKNLSHNYETAIAGNQFAKFFSKYDYRKVLLLALTRSGTTRDEVQGEYGQSGIRKLDELLKAEILFNSRGVIKAHEEKISFNQDILKDSLINCIEENYETEKFGKNENWLSFQTESVNKEKAMSLIRKKLQTAYKEIKDEILYSPEYYGNDKVFIGMVADSLLKDTPNSSEALQ